MKYDIPDPHMDVILKALQQQPWVNVNNTIQMLLTQANSAENAEARKPPKEAPNGN